MDDMEEFSSGMETVADGEGYSEDEDSGEGYSNEEVYLGDGEEVWDVLTPGTVDVDEEDGEDDDTYDDEEDEEDDDTYDEDGEGDDSGYEEGGIPYADEDDTSDDKEGDTLYDEGDDTSDDEDDTQYDEENDTPYDVTTPPLPTPGTVSGNLDLPDEEMSPYDEQSQVTSESDIAALIAENGKLDYTTETIRISDILMSEPKKSSRTTTYKGLTGSIRALGVLVPISVVVTEGYADAIEEGRGDDYIGGKYLLIDGFRRVFSASKLGMEEIKANICLLYTSPSPRD